MIKLYVFVPPENRFECFQGLQMPGSSSVGGLSNYSGLGGGGGAGRNPYLGSQLLAAGGGADAGLDPLAACKF